MSFPTQGKHSNCKAEEEKPGRQYETYQVSCWLQNKDPASEKDWERLNKQLRKDAAQSLTAVLKKAKKFRSYAHHFH